MHVMHKRRVSIIGALSEQAHAFKKVPGLEAK